MLVNKERTGKVDKVVGVYNCSSRLVHVRLHMGDAVVCLLFGKILEKQNNKF